MRRHAAASAPRSEIGTQVNARLGGAIGRRIGQAAQPGHGADDGDLAAPARAHRRDGRLDRVEDAEHIDRQRPAHGLGVFDDLARRRGRSRRRRWRRRIRSVARIARPRRCARHGLAVAHIGDGHIDLPAPAARQASATASSRSSSRPNRERLAPSARIGERQRAADAARRAGDENASAPSPHAAPWRTFTARASAPRRRSPARAPRHGPEGAGTSPSPMTRSTRPDSVTVSPRRIGCTNLPAEPDENEIAPPGCEHRFERGEQFHAVHRRRAKADRAGQRIVEMQRIVVAGDRRVARERRRVEGTDDRHPAGLSPTVGSRRRSWRAPKSRGRGTMRSSVSACGDGRAVERRDAGVDGSSRGGVSSRRSATVTS